MVVGFAVIFGSVEERGGSVDDNFCELGGGDEVVACSTVVVVFGSVDDDELGGNVDDGGVFVGPISSSHLQQQLCFRRL